MQFQDIFSTLLLEMVKLLVAGVLGGFIGGWISFRTFQSQKKFETKIQDSLRRRDALTDILALPNTIFRDIHLDWQMPEGSKENSKEHIERLLELITRTRTLFLNDEDMQEVFSKLDSLIGSSFELMMRQGREPAVIIEEIKNGVENKIKAIDRALY